MKIHAVESNFCDNSDQSIIISNGDNIHVLNETASWVYEMIAKEDVTIDKLIKATKEKYVEEWDEKFDIILSDLCDFIKDLVEFGIIQIL